MKGQYMRRFLFHASFWVVIGVCVFAVWLLKMQAQTLTVRLYYSYPTLDMLSDGTMVVTAVPQGVTEIIERNPPRDSRDTEVRMYKTLLELCAVSQLPIDSNPAIPEISRILAKYKIVCPK